MHKYASSTPEARELVAELEFVWDQIKANSASSGETSPGTREYEKQQAAQMSYASLGGTRPGREDEGARLRELRPFSEGDEDEDEEGDFGNRGEEARYLDPNTSADVAAPVGEGRDRDYDVRNRKWRKRVEMALFKMTTEIAALREQIEAKKIGSLRARRRGIWNWIRWLIWIAIRQVLVDTLLVGLIFIWARRKNDQRVEQGLWLVMTAVKEQLRQMKLLRGLRLPSLI